MNVYSPQDRGISAKVVWFLLTTATTIVVLLCGGWALAQTKEMDNIRARISVVEQSNAEVNAKLDLLLAHWGLKYEKGKK